MELAVERTGIYPLEVGISKLKGLALADISIVHKEEGLSWHKFREHLIEQYLNVTYVPDAIFAYSKISQEDNESTTEYLVRAKVLLERIHQTSQIVRNFRVCNGQPITHPWPQGTSYKEASHKGAGNLVHNGRCF